MPIHPARKPSPQKFPNPLALFAPAERMQHSLKEQLFSGEIHWWFSPVDEPSHRVATEADLATLSCEERQQRQSFLYKRDRTLYTEAHLLLRFALSQYLGQRPADLKFKNGDFGRPELDCSKTDPRVRFSISHTKGLVSCAIVLEDDVGVDAEQNTGRSFPEVSRNFASFEQADLAALPAEAQSARFFEYWTLKESYLKARGLGFQLLLDTFWFLKADDCWNLLCPPDVESFPEAWRFQVVSPTGTHVAALAVRGQHHTKRKIRLVSFNRKAGSFSVAPLEAAGL